MVYVNQIDLQRYAPKKNRVFFGLLYSNATLTDVKKWFDITGWNISETRQVDQEMTPERFSKLIDKKAFINLQLASPRPQDIKYCVRLTDRLTDKEIERFAFVIFPYTDNNFQVVSRLYKQAFEQELEKEPVPTGLLEYYRK
jgi:hypothetical protein